YEFRNSIIDTPKTIGARLTSSGIGLRPGGTERFAGFHAVRAELKDAYRQLIAATAAGGALVKSELDLRTDLVFGLIEGVILVHRSDPERSVAEFARATADAALRIVGAAAA
ncbi:hypothetical protein ACWD25_54915, partial [Streptomyces sp. NPDC002920]